MSEDRKEISEQGWLVSFSDFSGACELYIPGGGWIAMLPKVVFFDHIEALKEFSKMINAVHEVTGGGIDLCNLNTLEGNVVDLLEFAMDDQGDWISYWLWELEFGEKYKPGCVTDNGVDVDLSTAEKLYDFLVSEHERGRTENKQD